MVTPDDDFGFDFELIEEEFISRMLSYSETLDKIAEPETSMARFGDSELKMLNSSFNIGFQKFSLGLQSALREVAAVRDANMLLAMPPVFKNQQWATLWNANYDYIKATFETVETFGNTAVSRPPCFNEMKAAAVSKWMSIWEGKRVLMVTGRDSRFKMYEEFFGNASQFDLYYGPGVDAFEHIDAIESALLKESRYDIYLLSLGPTATILAHRLFERGLKALDVGHLSASYAHYLGLGEYPEKIPFRPER